MSLRYLFSQILIACYLITAAAGTWYSFSRREPPIVPRPVWVFSYGMMAPYQGTRDYDERLLAQGLTDDGWETIDLRLYQPFMRGERAYRGYLPSFWSRGEDAWQDAHRQYALQLQRLEAAAGRPYQAVRLSRQRWPLSPAGYTYLQHEPFLTTQFIVQVP